VKRMVFDYNAKMNTEKLDADFVKQLRCPLSQSLLCQEGDFLVAQGSGLKYPIQNGIAVLLVDRAHLPAGVETFEQLLAQTKG